jgi:branched-subunit amino acid ABC-type transport system permease component
MTLEIIVLNALSRSMILFLIAAGLTIVFGLMGVVNFAHGAFYALGAFVGLTVVGVTGNFWLALLLAPLGVAVVGMALEYLTFRPLYDQEPIYQVLLTFGLIIVLEEIIRIIWSQGARNVSTPAVISGATDVLGFSYPAYRLFAIAIGVVVAVGLYLLIERTRIGIIIRAGTMDSDMVEAMGINIGLVFTVMFGFGVAIAAIGGIVNGGMTSVSPGMGMDVIILAFIVVVIGGVGSLTGSIAGSLVVGFTETIGGYYADQFVSVILFGLMIVVLLVRPTGLFGIEGVLDE